MPTPPSGHVGRKLVLFVALIGMIPIALEAWHEREQRADRIQQAEAASLNVARAVAREADAAFELAGTVLFGIVERLQNGGQSPEALSRLSRSMALATRTLETISDLCVFGADGGVIATSQERIPPNANVADRAYFQSHRSDASPAVRLSDPIRNRATGAWVMLVSRRVQHPDGSFAGVVTATVDVEHFVKRFTGFDVGSDGTIALLTREGKVMARRPFADAQIGRDVSASPLFRVDLARGPSGVGRYVSPIDGGTRFAGFATARVFPVVAYAAISESEVLASWRQGAIARIGILIVLLVALASLGMKLVRDMRRRGRAEAELARSETRYRMLAENTSDVITRLDLAFRRTYVSPSCRRLFGYVPAEMLGDQPSTTIHPEDAPTVREVAARLAAGDIVGDQTIITYRARHKRGHWIWIEAALHLARREDRTPDSIVCVLRDAGVRKADEAALLAAREQAERASAAKGEFLAAMSHEIRTPLNAVIGFTDLLADDPQLGLRQRRHAERARDAGAALLTVVNDILDFSKVEAGAMTLHPRPFSIPQLVDNAVSIVRASAEIKGLTLTVEIDPDMPARLVGDENRLRQVLLNLLNNAIKFTAQGGVALAVLQERGGSVPCALVVRVSDTGTGIAADQLDRLFERFSQVDGTNARNHGGTGLGLAISKRLVEVMGGEIGVESREGAGSTFWFRVELPIAGADVMEGATAPSDDHTPAGRMLRLLLVDDVALNRELAGAVLRRAGHCVEVATDGREAVRVAAENRHDLILMDMQMPGMDGLEAARRIRGLGTAAARMPIVAMTANVLPEQVAACRAAGMDGHVGKPFRPEDLLAAIARATDRTILPNQPQAEAEDRQPLNQAVLDDLVDLVGNESVGRLLAGLQSHLQEHFDGPLGSLSPDRLASDAHATASAAGQLGFEHLSDLCRRLERACREKADSAADLEARVRSACELAKPLIEQARREALAA